MDSNKAEVYALLVGHRELLKLGGYFSLIDVDSFSAIQWRSGNTSFISLVIGGLGGGV